MYQSRAFVTAILTHPLDVRCTNTLINLCKFKEVVIVDKCKIAYYQIDKCNMAYYKFTFLWDSCPPTLSVDVGTS